MEADLITVEFLGMPRQRAGREKLRVKARTVGEMLRAVQETCPGLADLKRPDGCLAPHYLVSIDGKRFTSDDGDQLAGGARVLILSADAGG